MLNLTLEAMKTLSYRQLFTGDLIAYCSMRLAGAVSLPIEWTQEQLDSQVERAVRLLAGQLFLLL